MTALASLGQRMLCDKYILIRGTPLYWDWWRSISHCKKCKDRNDKHCCLRLESWAVESIGVRFQFDTDVHFQVHIASWLLTATVETWATLFGWNAKHHRRRRLIKWEREKEMKHLETAWNGTCLKCVLWLQLGDDYRNWKLWGLVRCPVVLVSLVLLESSEHSLHCPYHHDALAVRTHILLCWAIPCSEGFRHGLFHIARKLVAPSS